MARTSTCPNAAEAYEAHYAAIRLLLKKLPVALDEHDRIRSSRPGASADWGFVGDLATVECQLNEVLRMLGH